MSAYLSLAFEVEGSHVDIVKDVLNLLHPGSILVRHHVDYSLKNISPKLLHRLFPLWHCLLDLFDFFLALFIINHRLLFDFWFYKSANGMSQ